MSPATVWIDIENPPQVQYLLPFREALAAHGLATVITTRDHDATLRMLNDAGVPAHAFGAVAGRSIRRKLTATARRARALTRFFGPSTPRPVAQLGASRAAVLAAWRLGIPSFVIVDYEHVFLRLYRLTGSNILFPEVIGAEPFRRQGLRPGQLTAFKGIKEDITFAGVDIDASPPADLGPAPAGAARVLCRPPSETSHYYRPASTSMLSATLHRLAQTDAQVVLAPRAPAQEALLHSHPWKHPPITLSRPVPFVSLLKSVDAVVCSGGTMLREAAYLGIPAYSILQNPPGAVDRWLERIGRAKLLATPGDLEDLENPAPRAPLARLDSNPELLSELAGVIAAGARYQR